MATLLAHIKVRPGAEARFEQVAAEMYRRSHADEAGVRRYEYWRGAEPGTYYCLESFDDELGFVAHQTSEHHTDASPAFGEVIESLRLEWVDPLGAASPLAPTERTPLPEGTPADEVRYLARFAVAVQEWWQPLRAQGAPR